MIKIAFAGNPNVGKTALINNLAGSDLQVGNWPGVTVEKKEAEFKYKGETIKLIDLPGVYSLTSHTVEERITRDYILEEKPDLIINVVDSTNMERNLYLTMLLKELNRPMLLALNFYDEFEKLGYSLNIEKFSKFMEMETVTTIATKSKTREILLEKALNIIKEKKSVEYKSKYQSVVQRAIDNLACELNQKESLREISSKYSKSWLSVALLEKDKSMVKQIEEIDISVMKRVEVEIQNLENRYDEDVETILVEQRYGLLKGILEQTLKTSMKSRLDFTDKIDKILLNRFWGLIIFFGMMYSIFVFTFEGSAPFIDWIDGFINSYVGKYIAAGIYDVHPDLQALVNDGVIGGVGGVIVFVPLMLFLYFFLAILEESGYMTRVAFLMDKFMRGLGLSGKAFLPLIIGFGCTVPAIYATRTLEDEKSKRLTAIMAPFMSCGARLPIYALFTAAFFPKNRALIVLSLYMLGVVVAVIVGLIVKRFSYFKSDEDAMLIELPPYRIPTWRMVWTSMWTKTKGYVKKAGSVILFVLIILWALQYYPSKGEPEHSYIGKFGKVIAPVFKPAGFGNSWEAPASILPSIIAKEIVVGFMGQALKVDKNDIEETEEKIELNFLKDSGEQIKGLLFAIKDSVVAMISFKSGSFNISGASEGSEGVIGAIRDSKLFTPLSAYAFMAFMLLVVPCVVTIAAVNQEFGLKFTLLQIGIMIITPWIVSVIIYQGGRLLGFE